MAGSAAERPATEKQAQVLPGDRGIQGGARLPAVGPRDRRTRRPLVSSTMQSHLKASRTPRADLARSHQAARPRSRMEPSQRRADARTRRAADRRARSPPACRSRRPRISRAMFCCRPAFVPRASDAFMLRVQGDSMIEAAILDGDLIVVRPQPDGRKRRDRGRHARRRGDRQTLLPRGGRIRLAAGEFDDGANLRRAMSRSSAGSRPSSGAYSAELFRWFEQHAVPVMRRLGDWPFVVAVREALPWSIVGLAAAFAVVLFVAPESAGTSPSLGLRIAGALLPAFGVMAAVLAVMLPIRFAPPAATRSHP